MEDVLSIAVKILDDARLHIQANMAKKYRNGNGDERWVDASGRSSAAFQVEEDGNKARLVYRGDDIAPLDSIQYGHDEPPTIGEARQWRRDKAKSGAKELPSANGIVRGIEERGGTERFIDPQEWIMNPVIEGALDALNEQIPQASLEAVSTFLFGKV